MNIVSYILNTYSDSQTFFCQIYIILIFIPLIMLKQSRMECAHTSKDAAKSISGNAIN